MQVIPAALTLGPVLFNWKPEHWRDFYFQIADESPISIVYLGEVICHKRAPLFADYFDEVRTRLVDAGKTVVLSTLAEVVLKHDRQMVQDFCVAAGTSLVEANDASALSYLRGRPHHIGPFMNVYNERSVAFFSERGAKNICLQAEMAAPAIEAICAQAKSIDTTIEVQVFGRVSLALSARCYHARAHGRTKDTCQFVCENDPDGLELRTLDGSPFLTINGVQVLSREYLNLINELPGLRAMGASRFRLWPHSDCTIAVASIFKSVLDGRVAAPEAAAQLEALKLPVIFSNGFYHGKPGFSWVQPADNHERGAFHAMVN